MDFKRNHRLLQNIFENHKRIIAQNWDYIFREDVFLCYKLGVTFLNNPMY